MTSQAVHKETQVFVLERPGGLRIQVMDLGATWLSCEVPLATGERREVLLGCPGPEQYTQQTAYLGATIGRYANRIANAQFTLDGQIHQLTANNGPHNLHGGPQGLTPDTGRWCPKVSRNWSLLWILLKVTRVFRGVRRYKCAIH